jgi:uncharacterized protein (TIGR02391 family)
VFRDKHEAAAVFEAGKAARNRVKKMTGLSGDGAGLMGNAFKDDHPALVLVDLTTPTGKDIQAGYRFLFMGSRQTIRNPAAHEQFGKMDYDEALGAAVRCTVVRSHIWREASRWRRGLTVILQLTGLRASWS